MAADIGVLADELYALPAEDFVAERDRQAKQLRAGGDRDLAGQVAGLAKPTVAAWLLNQLARRRTAELEELLALGAELREAQQSLDGDQMRALNRQRQQVVRAFSRQVGELADELGRPMSGSVTEQVDETLRAAVADEEAGQALLSGRLTTALSYVGMGEGSVSAAVAVPRAPSAKDRRGGQTKGGGSGKGSGKGGGRVGGRVGGRAGGSDAPQRRGKKQADRDDADELAAAREQRRQAAVDELDTRLQEAEAAAESLSTLDEEVAELAERAEQLRGRLEALRSELSEVDSELDETRGRRDAADQDARAAQQAAETARRTLDGLEDT